jgi:hypothetical protein
MAGYRRVMQLPENLRPALLRTFDLSTMDTYFIWPSVREAGKNIHQNSTIDFGSFSLTINSCEAMLTRA